MNYGYALVRAKIQKSLAVHGFEQAIGIHHRSTENPYNLSDDLIEVFRPFVDSFVYEFIFLKDVVTLEHVHKEKLLSIFLEQCVIDEKVMTIFDAVDTMIQSLIMCYEENSTASLCLPKMIEEGP